MTDQDRVYLVLDEFGPLSDYGIRHAARAIGMRMTESSARTRRRELEKMGLVRWTGEYELSDTGYRAKVWALDDTFMVLDVARD